MSKEDGKPSVISETIILFEKKIASNLIFHLTDRFAKAKTKTLIFSEDHDRTTVLPSCYVNSLIPILRHGSKRTTCAVSPAKNVCACSTKNDT